MADNEATPQKRVLPARERRESAAKRRASSPPKPPVTAAKRPATPPATPATEPKPKRPYIKRSSLVNVHTPTRNASAADSSADDLLPARLAGSKPLPATQQPQPDDLPLREYQKVADSAVLMASLHRSRMQWLCDGVFKKYWTKPVKRKGQIEAPPNNPDAKSMIKLGPATITIEPYTFDATFYIVRDTQAPPVQPVFRPPPAPVSTPATAPAHQPIPAPSHTPTPAPTPAPAPATTAVHPPTVSSVPAQPKQPFNPPPAPPAHAPPTPAPPTPAPAAVPKPQPPSNPRTNDPVIQMLAARAATDNRLKDLMKVVATSRASPEQLREFQTHINEFTLIAERQKAEQERLAKLQSAPKPTPPKPHTYAATYPTTPRPEPAIKHIVVEFTSPVSHNQAATSDRWLFPDHAVLDLPYAGLEMTCSFLIERKGSEIPGVMGGSHEDDNAEWIPKYEPDVEYYEPVTITVRTTQHRVLETIAKSAKTLSEVQKHMQQVMEKKTRAPQGYLVHQLPKDKPDTAKTDFIDSAVELSTEEEDELKALYPM